MGGRNRMQVPRRFLAVGDDGGGEAYANALITFLEKHRALWQLYAVDFLTEKHWWAWCKF